MHVATGAYVCIIPHLVYNNINTGGTKSNQKGEGSSIITNNSNSKSIRVAVILAGFTCKCKLHR